VTTRAGLCRLDSQQIPHAPRHVLFVVFHLQNRPVRNRAAQLSKKSCSRNFPDLQIHRFHFDPRNTARRLSAARTCPLTVSPVRPIGTGNRDGEPKYRPGPAKRFVFRRAQKPLRPANIPARLRKIARLFRLRTQDLENHPASDSACGPGHSLLRDLRDVRDVSFLSPARLILFLCRSLLFLSPYVLNFSCVDLSRFWVARMMHRAGSPREDRPGGQTELRPPHSSCALTVCSVPPKTETAKRHFSCLSLSKTRVFLCASHNVRYRATAAMPPCGHNRPSQAPSALVHRPTCTVRPGEDFRRMASRSVLIVLESIP